MDPESQAVALPPGSVWEHAGTRKRGDTCESETGAANSKTIRDAAYRFASQDAIDVKVGTAGHVEQRGALQARKATRNKAYKKR
jgi:hypothetical protein